MGEMTLIVTWIVLALQGLAILALFRQVGLLHMRIRPTGARVGNSGPEIGTRAPSFSLRSMAGSEIMEVNSRGVSSLFVFVLPGCNSCDDLMRSAASISRTDVAKTDVFIMSMVDDETKNIEFLTKHNLSPEKYAVATSIVDLYQIGGSPYSILLDAKGMVISKGLANTLEHVESLLNARDEGFSTHQERLEFNRASANQQEAER